MAYDRAKLYEQALTALEENKDILFVEDLVSMLGIHKATFYRLFPIKSDECDTIKKALNRNKTRVKMMLRKQWMEYTASASLQIALYKLLATPDELARLTNKPTAEQQEDKVIQVQFVDAKELEGLDEPPKGVVGIENYVPMVTDKS